MSKPVEQALVGLVPAHNGPLPSELLSVAVSLLAQSRSKASSLRPEEEIARTYACAHLACERLKQRLNLPSIVPRPPIPPRAYKKVYNYFDSALTISSSQPQTPSRRAARAAAAESSATTPTRKRTPAATTAATPSRTPTRTASHGGRAGARTPTAASARRSTAAGGEYDDDGVVPAYVTPLIRALSKALGTPPAVPHVYAGVRSVLKEATTTAANSTPSRSSARKRRSGGQEGIETLAATNGGVDENDIPPLVAVLLMYTIIRLSGRPTRATEHRGRKEEAVRVLAECEACEGLAEDELLARVERLLVEVKERGWLEMEWFENVGQKAGGDGDEDVEMGEDGEEDDGSELGRDSADVPPYTPMKKRKTGDKGMDVQAGVSQGGLGTMMQDKVDYLSEARRAGFLRWKAGIMKRVEQIEREDGQAMDVST
ncbi:hypothetical protein DIS24_g9480 [Lasiodiplodia hormozganensis]|uniref:ORC6 first cyclin-like domain-containing protein n=1 Tax=Lasiodiplodia hormozganensis TaxID=869390 RepID=A0AA40CK23_9PEZI|nr:hypothetical protein DIS24_g9480 [Lasiodiplodia hormozganensis]